MNKMKTWLAFAALLLCGGAWAAIKPVAVWDGNFKTTTCGVVTMDVLGNTVADDGSTITIKDGATQGVKFSWATGRDGYTIIAKVRTLKTSSSRQVLVNGGANGNRTGVTWETDGTTKGIWDNTSWDNNVSYVQKKGNLSAVEDSDTFYIAGRHKSSNGGVCGTYLFANTGSGWESVYEASGCRADGDKTAYTAVSLGGPITANANTFVAAAGMVIEKVAIFHAHLTQDEIAEYQFPAPIDYSRWSENIAVMTWQGTNGNSFHPGPWSKFDLETKTDSTTTWGGTSDVSGVPGQSANVTPWTVFCVSTVAATANHYIAPGYVLRLAAYKGTAGTLNATFSTLALGGLIVEDYATGYSMDSGSDSRDTSLGNRDASSNVETWFEIRENFKIARKGALVLFGTLNFDIADGCVFDLNSTKSAQQLKFDTGKAGVLKMHGKGTLKVATLTATGDVTLDFSDLAADRATPYIQGNLTVDDSTKINLPAGLAENTAYTLCTGMLSAPQVPVHTTAIIGTESKDVVLTYNATNKTVSYAADTSVFWTPNTEKKDADGILDWTAEGAWIDNHNQSQTWSDQCASVNVRIDASQIAGVKISGAVSVNELIVECADNATHPFEFHNSTKGVEGDTTTDDAVDCLTASAVNLAAYKGNLGLKVPIKGPINFSAGTHLVFRTGATANSISHAYAYNISGNTAAIQVSGIGKFQVPATMYTIPFAPDSTATIIYDDAQNHAISGKISGEGTVILDNGKTLTLDPCWNQELHYVSAGTTANTLSWVGDGNKDLSRNDSKERPIVAVENGATLNIYGHDYAGWNGRLGNHSWFVNNGTLVFQSDGGSRFWRDHIVLGNGSKVKIDTGDRHLLLYGGAGTENSCQIMLASGMATIEAGVTNTDKTRQSLYFGNDGSGTYGDDEVAGHGAGISVGSGATLTVSVPVAGGDTLTKWGAGSLVLQNITGYTGTITLQGGTITVPAALADGRIVSGDPLKKVFVSVNKDRTFTYYAAVAQASITIDDETSYYPTVDAAIAYAEYDGLMVVLENDVTLEEALNIPDGVTLDTNKKSFTGTINGAGEIIYDGKGGTTVPTFTIGSEWTGIITIKNFGTLRAAGDAVNDDLNGLFTFVGAHKVKFSGVMGWYTGSTYPTDLILEDGTNQNDSTGNYGWRNDNGIWNALSKFPKLSGTGTFRGTRTQEQMIAFADVSGFEGTITTEGKRVTLGGDANACTANGQIYVKTSAKIATTWTASGGLIVDAVGTIGGEGTINASLTLNNGATIDVTDGALTLAEGKTLTASGTIKVKGGMIGGLFLKTSVDPSVTVNVAILDVNDNVTCYGAAQYDSEKGGLVIGESSTILTIREDTTLESVVSSGKNQIFVSESAKITGSGVLTVSSITCAANKTLTIGAGVTLQFTDGTIQIPDGLVLEAGAKISGTAVPNFAGKTFKVDGASMTPGAYTLADWTDFMAQGNFGYGAPTLEVVGECANTYQFIPMVGKIALKVFSAEEVAAKPIRIWPVGDSITEGYNDSGNCANYRVQLAAKLTLAGHKVQMVGQNTHRSFMPSGEAAPDEWAWHSGVSAQRVWTGGSGNNMRAGYMEAIDAAMFQVGEADIVLVKLGTNDIGNSDSADHILSGVQEICRRIAEGMPKAKIVLGTTVWYKGNDVDTLNNKVKAWVATNPHNGRVILADLNAALPAKEDARGRVVFHTDNVHPNWNGHDKMSDAWLVGVNRAIAAGIEASPTKPAVQLGAENNIPEEYRRYYTRQRKLEIQNSASYAKDVGESIWTETSGQTQSKIRKVAYYMELVRPATAFRQEEIRYIWVDMDAPGRNFADVTFPLAANKQQVVNKLHVYSNMGSVHNVDADDDTVQGFLEFSPFNATPGNCSNVAGAPANNWNIMDWNDTLGTSGDGRGVMQIHRIKKAGDELWTNAEVLFAYNNWGSGNDLALKDAAQNQTVGELGIGNYAQHWMTSTETDRTSHPGIGKAINNALGTSIGLNNNWLSIDYSTTRFSPWADTMNAKAYSVKNLEIWTIDDDTLPVAIVDGHNYDTLADAIEAAGTDKIIDVVLDPTDETIELTHDVKIAVDESFAPTIAANFTGAHKITKVGKGTIKLTGSNAFNAYDIQGGAIEMTSASAIAASATLDGSGRVIFNQVCQTASDNQTPRFTIQDTWTGTIEFKNVGTNEILDGADIIIFGKWANMNSAIALNGVTSTMYSNDKTDYKDNLFVFGTLEICGNGWTSTTGAYGVSPLYKCNLTGNGTITVKQPGNGTHAVNFVGDHSGFTGSVVISGSTKGVVFSPAGSDRLWTGIEANKIIVQPGAVVGGSGTWTASASIVVNGELTFVSQPTITGTISGSGRLGFAMFSHVPSGVKTNLQSSNWTGTLVINGGALNDGTVSSHYTTLNDFGNADSKIELAGTLGGYFGLSMINAGDAPRVINPEIVIVGTWNPESGYSQADNSRNYCTIIRKLSGDGTINGTTGQPQLFYILDGSEFTGTLAAKVTKFVFGARVNDSLITNGSVTVFDTGIISSQMTIDSNNAVALNGVVSIPAGSTLTAGDTIYSYTGTLDVGATARAAVAGTIDSRFTLKGANDNHDAVLEAVAEDAPIVVPVVPDAGVIVEPGANVTVPAGTAEAKISVKYTDANGTTTDLKTSGYVTVVVADNGAVTVTPTDDAKPAETKIKMTLPKEGEGEGAKDKVSFTITDPIPGLFYSIVSADDPTEFDKQSGAVEDSDGVQATNSDPHTTSIDMPDAKVKYFRVRVKATK